MHVMAPVCTTTGQQEFLCEDDVLHDLDREEPETWSETCDKKVGKVLKQTRSYKCPLHYNTNRSD